MGQSETNDLWMDFRQEMDKQENRVDHLIGIFDVKMKLVEDTNNASRFVRVRSSRKWKEIEDNHITFGKILDFVNEKIELFLEKFPSEGRKWR